MNNNESDIENKNDTCQPNSNQFLIRLVLTIKLHSFVPKSCFKIKRFCNKNEIYLSDKKVQPPVIPGDENYYWHFG